jgi:hypothetical protein
MSVSCSKPKADQPGVVAVGQRALPDDGPRIDIQQYGAQALGAGVEAEGGAIGGRHGGSSFSLWWRRIRAGMVQPESAIIIGISPAGIAAFAQECVARVFSGRSRAFKLRCSGSRRRGRNVVNRPAWASRRSRRRPRRSSAS